MPKTIEQRQTISAKEFGASAEADKRVELIEGEVAMMSAAGYEHNFIGFRFQKIFDAYAAEHAEWLPGFDNDMFLVERAPDTLLCPDASLFRRRETLGEATWMEFAPEIVVEVLSPSNSPAQMTWKRHKYFKGGTAEVWFASPVDQSMEIYFPDGRCLKLSGDEVYSCELLDDGLEIQLAEIFAPI